MRENISGQGHLRHLCLIEASHSDSYRNLLLCRLIVTDAHNSELHAKLEAAEGNVSASQEAARVAHQRKVEAEENVAHLVEQLRELQAKAKHTVSLL